MKLRKVLNWGVLLTVLALLGTAGILYFVAASVPAYYQPAELSPDDRQQAATNFLLQIQKFGNLAQRNEPFDWTITQEEINDALASLDEIAGRTQEEGKTLEVGRMMAKIGIDSPAVAFGDGVMSLMVRSREYNKVVSADLTFALTPEKLLRVHLAGAHVGHLPMPDSTAQKFLEKLKAGVGRKVGGTARSSSAPTVFGAINYDDLSGVLAQVISAIDAAPIPTERVWPVNKKAFRIDGLKIEPGKLTLHVLPVGRP